MKKFQSHKVVEAGKIVEIRDPSVAPPDADGSVVLIVEDAPDIPRIAGTLAVSGVSVSAAYMAKHQPTVGGYYVRYPDGYESFSPAEAFESGYVPATAPSGLSKVEGIARLCHELNRAYCALLGDTSQVPWDAAPEWQKASAIAGVEHALAGTRTPEQSHESWLAQKSAEGWTYGPVKDVEKKEHPCFVPYAELPDDQKLKDALFLGVVNAISGKAEEDRERRYQPTRAAAAAQMARIPEETTVKIAGLPFRLLSDAIVEGTQAHVNKALEEQAAGDAVRTGTDGSAGALTPEPIVDSVSLERFLLQRLGQKLTVKVAHARRATVVRFATIDQADVLEGAVEGNEFRPTTSTVPSKG